MTTIKGKEYFIHHGHAAFDTDKELDVFREIVRGIDAIRHFARIVGVLLVTRINQPRVEEIDDKLLKFDQNFFGE